MPMRELSVVEQREAFVGLAMMIGANRSGLCREFGISRKTRYKWLGRHRLAGDMVWSIACVVRTRAHCEPTRRRRQQCWPSVRRATMHAAPARSPGRWRASAGSRYNHERPHEALSLQPPVRRYRPSPRVFCESLPPIEDGPGGIVRKVEATVGSASGIDRSALARHSAGSQWRRGLAVTRGCSTSIAAFNASAGLISERSTDPPVGLQQHQVSDAL